MSRRDLIDPDARQPLDLLQQAIPGGFNTIPDIVQRRATVSGLLAAMEVPPNPNVTSEDRSVPGPDGAPDIKVRIYRPVDATGTLPGIYYIHGGGMILGDLDGEDAVAARSASTRTRWSSPSSTGWPRAPLPGAGRGLLRRPGWMAGHAAELGFDPDRLAVYGGSAGGGLTIAITMLARDRGGPAIRFQMPIYPMIDDRNETPSSHEITDVGLWDRAGNIEAWKWYLGDEKADQYAAPARAENLAGLPPTFIDVGTVTVPGRGHRVRAAAHASRCADRAARQSRFLSRGGSVRA
jgi:Esterase/lipase